MRPPGSPLLPLRGFLGAEVISVPSVALGPWNEQEPSRFGGSPRVANLSLLGAPLARP